MRYPNLKSSGLALMALASSALACLPKDTRPPPASLLVTTSSDDAVQNGFNTDDGWFIQFTKFVVAIGRSSLDGNACNSYSNASYVRVLNMQQAGQQELNLIYGLGQCDFSFRVAHPVTTSLVGSGVSAADVLYMQTDSSDKYTVQAGLTNSGVVAIISGIATGYNEQKTFSWSFRLNEQYSTCSVESDAGVDEGLNLIGLASDTLNILVRGEALFQSDVNFALSNLRFGPMALADSVYGNNDGSVTLDELGLVPVSMIADAVTPTQTDAGSITGPNSGDAGLLASGFGLDAGTALLDGSVGYYFTGNGAALVLNNLEDVVYLGLFPTIFNYRDTGQCVTAVATPGGGR